MCDFLCEKNIPALLFVRGDMADAYGTEPLVRAVKHGFVLGNHAYTHTRFSELSFDAAINEIETTEKIINSIYEQAGVERKGKYFRSPHMDRGMGGYIVDYDAYPENQRDFVTRLFADGINIKIEKPTAPMIEHKNKIQAYLKNAGFKQPFENINYSWFQNTEMERAQDCMYTFSTSDWMLLDRHRGKWPYKTLDDLKVKINEDPFLHNESSHAIILIHDKPEPEFPPVFKSLIDHMAISGYDFLPIP